MIEAIGYAIQGIVVTALLWVVFRERARERAYWADRESEWAEERAALLQRIQAPQAAVVQHYNREQEFESPRAVNPDLDEDHWVDKEDLARLAAREELNGTEQDKVTMNRQTYGGD